jgi:hypothetical protein
MQKVHVKNFFRENSQKIDEHFDVVFPRFLFCFIAFSGVSLRWEFKYTTKNVLQKILPKSFYKKTTKKSQTESGAMAPNRAGLRIASGNVGGKRDI